MATSIYLVQHTTITVSVTWSNQANMGLADCQESWPAFSLADGHSHYDRKQTKGANAEKELQFYHSITAKHCMNLNQAALGVSLPNLSFLPRTAVSRGFVLWPFSPAVRQ